jgi:alpha-N-arabinofuranosidase
LYLHHADNEEVRFDIRGRQTIQVTGTVLTADSIQTHNTFVEPDAIAPKDFSDFCIEDDQLQ